MSLTICSILSVSAFGASSKSKCASSKNITNFGLSASPTSGKFSNNSDSNHNKIVAYKRGDFCMSCVTSITLMNPRPDQSIRIKSSSLKAGSPKKFSTPCCCKMSRSRCIAPMLTEVILPYSPFSSLVLLLTHVSIDLRSLKSSNNNPLSSAILKQAYKTPV